MSAQKVGLKIVDDTKPVPILEFLGIKVREAEITGFMEEGQGPRYRFYTRDQLNRLVGIAAIYPGVDIDTVGAPFIREYGRGLPAGIPEIAERLRTRKLDVIDMGGLKFEIEGEGTEDRHGRFFNAFGVPWQCVHSFEDALVTMIKYEKIPAPVAAKLLQEVIAADLPVIAPSEESGLSTSVLMIIGAPRDPRRG